MEKDHVLFNNKGASRGVSRVLQPRQVPLKHQSISSLHNVHILLLWAQIMDMAAKEHASEKRLATTALKIFLELKSL
jgi:hypothetical protein